MALGGPTSAAEGSPAADPFAVDAGAPAGAGPPPALAIASSASSTVTYLGDNLSPPQHHDSTQMIQSPNQVSNCHHHIAISAAHG